jgi:hypothetical protein
MIRYYVNLAIVIIALAAGNSSCRAEGDVTAELIDGTLYVAGDGENNEISVKGDLDTLTLSIAGDLTALFPLDAITAVVINSGGGDDTVVLDGAIAGAVALDTGAGADAIALSYTGPLDVLGDVSIETGKDRDEVFVGRVSIAGSLDISTGHGVDSVRFSIQPCEIGGSLCINTGLHGDHVQLGLKLTVAEDFLLDLGLGDDIFSVLSDRKPVAAIGGSARLHGDQGFDQIFVVPSYYDLDEVVLAEEGLEVVGFE